jgi:putative ABC transport system substrate-binding protein
MTQPLSRRALLAAGAAGAALAPLAGRAAVPKSQRPYRVFMLVWRGWEEACEGFKDYFDTRGIPIELTVADAGENPNNVPRMVAQAKAAKPDLVYVWGTTTALLSLGPAEEPDPRRYITDLPVVFNIVTEPLANGLIRSLEQPGRNVTGTLYVVPVDVQLNTMAAYREFHRVGVIYNPREKNSLLTVELLRAAAKDKFELLDRPLPLDSANMPIAGKIADVVTDVAAQKADWLYIPPDTFLNLNRTVLTGTALARGLPTFSASERFIKQGDALVGLVSRYYGIGQFTAYKAEQILVQGKRPEDIPVEALNRFSLLINMRVANALRFYPPVRLLRSAEVV